MKIITKHDLLENEEFYVNEIASGKVFIYPTDTIYGIGCNAKLSSSVDKIIAAKKRNSNPMSVIAPNREWVDANLRVTDLARSWLNKLPGPYTFILSMKNSSLVSPNTNNNSDTLGVRIPDCWFSEIVRKSWVPFITTSVNISSETAIRDVSEIPESMKGFVDYVVDGGVLDNPPSKVIDLTGDVEVVLRDQSCSKTQDPIKINAVV